MAKQWALDPMATENIEIWVSAGVLDHLITVFTLIHSAARNSELTQIQVKVIPFTVSTTRHHILLHLRYWIQTRFSEALLIR